MVRAGFLEIGAAAARADRGTEPFVRGSWDQAMGLMVGDRGCFHVRKSVMLVVVATCLASPAWAAPPSAAAGAAISAQCAACHGSNGISPDTSTPNLAGQHYQYLLSQIEAYKSGTRKNPIMNEMTKPLSQEQMEDLAAYFASIVIRVGTPALTGGLGG